MTPGIDTDRTLPASFYNSDEVFELLKLSIFQKSWHYAGSIASLEGMNNIVPFQLLPGFLDEPLVLTRDRQGEARCLTNVCTHRGSLVATEPSHAPLLRCPYHGRCFGLDGAFRSMPGFEGVPDFPTADDDLKRIDMKRYGPMAFVKLDGELSFTDQFEALYRYMGWRSPDGLELRAEASRVYEVDAHWCLYVDNFLEGFHVPYVHPGLKSSLDVQAYAVECYANSVLQIGFADRDEQNIIEIPPTSQFYGERIFALYWWVFPNMMFNFYPWGISLNVVEPVSKNKTRIRFETYVEKGLPTPDVSGIHQTEIEDETVVHLVQKGLQSRYYSTGRYSIKHEQGVHHFHSMLKNHVGEI